MNRREYGGLEAFPEKRKHEKTWLGNNTPAKHPQQCQCCCVVYAPVLPISMTFLKLEKFKQSIILIFAVFVELFRPQLSVFRDRWTFELNSTDVQWGNNKIWALQLCPDLSKFFPEIQKISLHKCLAFSENQDFVTQMPRFHTF